MGATLLVADQHRAYTLTDRATYLALRSAASRLTLVPVVEGDARLRNVYHVYVVNPIKHPKVRRAQAAAFVAFLVAPPTQRLIERFGTARYGQPLFIPDAGKPDPGWVTAPNPGRPATATALISSRAAAR